ncbi:hypothetical protein QR680_011315 [Steinernema hermaphroditum]|uniref:Uncharacterized protein n=1 Tax=Steinernema hermaphroditum TaxID=289476 RepID=A0AA39MC35_9BILA|nr:hypothetical protein QR680_011315 [Steinernema hermaphroditum]
MLPCCEIIRSTVCEPLKPILEKCPLNPLLEKCPIKCTLLQHCVKNEKQSHLKENLAMENPNLEVEKEKEDFDASSEKKSKEKDSKKDSKEARRSKERELLNLQLEVMRGTLVAMAEATPETISPSADVDGHNEKPKTSKDRSGRRERKVRDPRRYTPLPRYVPDSDGSESQMAAEIEQERLDSTVFQRLLTDNMVIVGVPSPQAPKIADHVKQMREHAGCSGAGLVRLYNSSHETPKKFVRDRKRSPTPPPTATKRRRSCTRKIPDPVGDIITMWGNSATPKK